MVLTERRGLGRRALLAAALAAPALARAEPWLRDQLVIYAEPTLLPVLRRLGARFTAQGAGPVYVFVQPTAQNIALLAHAVQDDLLIGLAALAPEAARQKLIAPPGPPIWRNRLVLAARGSGPARDFDADAARAMLGGGVLAATDPSEASSLDGRAVIDRLGLATELGPRLAGAARTEDVADMLRSGEAALGLLHATDIAPGLYAALRVPDPAYPPIAYCAAKSRAAWSRNSDRFLAYLATGEARDAARAAGLEVLA